MEYIYKTYSTFQQTLVYILYTKLYELWQLNFVYKVYTKVCQSVEYILCTFWVHFVYINSDLQKVYIINTVYTMCIQNLCKMYVNSGMQNAHVSAYFDLIVVLFQGI